MNRENTWRTRESLKIAASLSELKKQNDMLREENEELYRMYEEKEKEYNALAAELEQLKKQKTEEVITQNQGDKNDTVILSIGEEKEFFNGEAKDFVLDSLKEYVRNAEPDRRRTHILKSILSANKESSLTKKREQIKLIMKDFTGMDTKHKKKLEEMGYTIVAQEGKKSQHGKVLYFGDPRYFAVTAGTGSDYRGGLNLASTLTKIAL